MDIYTKLDVHKYETLYHVHDTVRDKTSPPSSLCREGGVVFQSFLVWSASGQTVTEYETREFSV